MRADLQALEGELQPIGLRMNVALKALERAVAWIVSEFSSKPKAVHAGSVPFLHLFGIVVGGWQMGTMMPRRLITPLIKVLMAIHQLGPNTTRLSPIMATTGQGC